MNKVIGTLVALALTVVVILLVKNNKFSKSTKKPQDIFYSGAFAFKLEPIEKLGVAAKIMNTEISPSDLQKNSPVLKDLTLNKLQQLVESIEKKLEGMTKSAQKPKVILYMEKPSEDFSFDSENSDWEFSFSDERPKTLIAKINEQSLSAGELPLNPVRYAEVDTKIFNEKLRILSDLYTKNLLLKVSKENNTTIQGFINKTILTAPIKVSDKEAEDFAMNRGLSFNNSDSGLLERLKNILKQNKTQEKIEGYIAKNHPNEMGKIYFHPPSLKIPIFENKAVIDPKNDKTELPTFMIFSRLKCTSCGQLAETLSEVRKQYKDKIRIGFVHYFSSDNWQDYLTAEASLCLNLQSHDAFWDFFYKISKTEEEISESLILDTAKSTGVNFENFKKCFVGQSYKEEVEKQMNYAKDLGVTISPTVIFDTKVLTGHILKKQLKQTIDAGL